MNKLRGAISGLNYNQATSRARLGKSFRKRLGVYSYKIKKIGYHKNHHAMRLSFKEDMKKRGEEGWKKIREVSARSPRPFGRFTRKRKFFLDMEKVPFYNVPNISSKEELKPYVDYNSRRLRDEEVSAQRSILTPEIFEAGIKKIKAREIEFVKDYYYNHFDPYKID